MTHVLVVDDSLSVRKALETILRPLSYTVRMAESGEAALAALNEARADLVIADVLMPGLSGFELCEQIKGDPTRKDIPVILISGIVSDEERARADTVGARGLVKKPFRADDLLPVVQAAIAASAASAAAAAHPAGTSGAPDAPELGVLLEALLAKQGIVNAFLLDAQGATVASRGVALPDQDAVGQYARFFATASDVLGQRLDDGWQTSLLEFGKRAMLLAPISPTHTLAIVLRDAGAATVAKFIVKSQREQFASALAGT